MLCTYYKCIRLKKHCRVYFESDFSNGSTIRGGINIPQSQQLNFVYVCKLKDHFTNLIMYNLKDITNIT